MPSNLLRIPFHVNMSDESEELKTLTRHQLATILWPLRVPKENSSFLQEFAHHIRYKFNEPSPEKYNRELNEFSNLRNIATSVLVDNCIRDQNSLVALKRYYCQLISMFNRFRDSKAEFVWKDSFGRNLNEGNLEFEINNIMYNIATVHNEFGSKINRSSESSTKEACLHFNNALWWVRELRDNRSGLKPKEMGHDMLTFFNHVLQAQAQECVLTHSLRAGMKPDNVGKIAAQVASDYDVALKLAQTPLYTDPLRDIMNGASVFQNWRATVDFKYHYFQALTHLLLGMACADDSAKEIGYRIAQMRIAQQSVELAKKNISDTLDSQTSKSAYETLSNLISKKLDKAVRYNDNVYHSSIPARETLPQPEAKLLVAPVPFSVSSMPGFKDIFSSLVTIEAVQVNSIYSQKKDDLSRQISLQVEKQDEELVQMMSTLNVDKRSLQMPVIEAPDELIEICAELSMSPTIVDDVLTKLEELDDLSEEIQKMLDSIGAMLKNRPNGPLGEELKRYRSTHEAALRTTQSLHKQLYPELQQTIHLMATTNDAMDLLPKIDGTAKADDEVIRKLERLLNKIDEMKQQRSGLLAELRRSLNDDDVIKHVVAATSEQELKNVFDSEIQKHNKYLAPLQANLKLQKELLDTLERVNAQYGQVKLNHRARCAAYKERVESLRKFHTQFKTISDGVDEGLAYHKKMVELVRGFYAKVQTNNDLTDLLN